MFENTFFSLLSEVNSLLHDFLLEGEGNKINENIEKCTELEIICVKKDLKEAFTNINYGFMKTYFIMLYQLLKYIDKSTVKNKKSYTNIVRANLDSKILSLLAINCYVYNFIEYKNMLQKYSFFEHLDINPDSLFSIEVILKEYFLNLEIYGNNEELKEKLNSKPN